MSTVIVDTTGLTGVSFTLYGKCQDHLEYGVIKAIKGSDVLVESISRPGHTRLLPMTGQLDIRNEGHKILANYHYVRSARIEFDPHWFELREGCEIVFPEKGSVFVETWTLEEVLISAMVRIEYRAVRGDMVIADCWNLERLLSDVESNSTPKPGMEALAALLPKVQYQQKKFGCDWRNVNIVYE